MLQHVQAAMLYAELGYRVMPIRQNQKTPATSHGLKDATTDANQIVTWFENLWPNANVAISTDGLIVVDVDTQDDGSTNPWLSDDPDKLLDLSAGVLSLTPSGGRHYIFRQPDGVPLRNSTSKLAANVDVRADGGYILVAPSKIDGTPYRWANAPLDCEASKLPTPPAWLVEKLRSIDRGQTVRRVDGAHDGSPIIDGSRNATLTSLAGSMRRVGISGDAILAALLKTNSERCKPPLDAAEVEKIAWSVARYEPDAGAAGVIENQWAESSDSEAIDHDGGMADPGPFPKPLLIVPGFIGDVSRFSVETAHSPQPVLALAAALPLLGTLTGRKVTDAYGTRTNIMVVGVAESGSGKDRARVVNKETLFQSGLEKMIGPEGFASHVGIVNAVEKQPAILMQFDEIGRLFKTAGDAAKSPHLYHVPTVLMKLFTNSHTIYFGDAYADTDKNKSIDQPNVCVYATTVPKSFYEGLSADSISDGFLSRLLVFESDDDDPEPQEPVSQEVPKEILEIARWWGDFKPPGSGNMQDAHPQPMIVPYTDDAKAIFTDLGKLARHEKQVHRKPYSTLWTRTVEKARKFALLYACSVNHADPVVTKEAATWAVSLSEYQTRRMIYLASRYISENSQESNLKRVLRIIEDAGAEKISKTRLLRETQWLSRRERDETIATLIESGAVIAEQIPTTRKPRTLLCAARFAEPACSSS